MYIPTIGDCLKTLTDDEVKDFLFTNFDAYFKSMKEVKDFLFTNFDVYFKSMKEKLYSKLNEEQTLKRLLNHFISF